MFARAIKPLLFVSAALLCSGSVWSADTSTPPAPTKEQRSAMAQAHEQMATCLRSEKSLAECRQEMMQTCRGMSGYPGCGMGMMGGKQGGKMRMMNPPVN